MNKMLFFSFLFLVVLSCNNGSSSAESQVSSGESGWEVEYVLDQFGEPTEEKIVRKKIQGDWSNQSIKNEFLDVLFEFEPKSANLFMKKMGEIDVAVEGYPFEISMRNSSNEDITVVSYQSVKAWQGLMIAREEYKKLKNYILNSSGEIKVVVTNTDSYNADYVFRFTFDPSGLKEALDELEK